MYLHVNKIGLFNRNSTFFYLWGKNKLTKIMKKIPQTCDVLYTYLPRRFWSRWYHWGVPCSVRSSPTPEPGMPCWRGGPKWRLVHHGESLHCQGRSGWTPPSCSGDLHWTSSIVTMTTKMVVQSWKEDEMKNTDNHWSGSFIFH